MFVQCGLAAGIVFSTVFYVRAMSQAKTAWGWVVLLLSWLVLVAACQAAPLLLTVVPQNGQRVMYMNHKQCQSYQWLDEDWKCVPWEEAG